MYNQAILLAVGDSLELQIMRVFALVLVAFFPCGRSWAALAELAITPTTPTPADIINLKVTSPNGVTLQIPVDSILTNHVVFDNSVVQVTTNSMSPKGDIRLPSFEELDLTIELGKLSPGVYDLHYEYYGETGNLFISSASQFAVVPECPGQTMAIIAVAALLMSRSTSNRC